MRDGKFCAHLLVDDLLSETEHETAVRISAGLGTRPEHIDRLLGALRQRPQAIALPLVSGRDFHSKHTPSNAKAVYRP